MIDDRSWCDMILIWGTRFSFLSSFIITVKMILQQWPHFKRPLETILAITFLFTVLLYLQLRNTSYISKHVSHGGPADIGAISNSSFGVSFSRIPMPTSSRRTSKSLCHLVWKDIRRRPTFTYRPPRPHHIAGRVDGCWVWVCRRCARQGRFRQGHSHDIAAGAPRQWRLGLLARAYECDSRVRQPAISMWSISHSW